MHRVRTTMTLFAMLISGAAVAQTPPPEAAPPEAPPAPPPAEVAAPPAPEAPPPAPMAPPPPPAAAPKETFVPPAQPSMKIETPNKSISSSACSCSRSSRRRSRGSARRLRRSPASATTSTSAARASWSGGTLFGGCSSTSSTPTSRTCSWPERHDDGRDGHDGDEPRVKNTPGMNIQDAFITYKAIGDMVKIDAGYMLPPLAHNAVQGATTLYAWDYFFYTFRSGNAFGSSGNPIGRDAGLQLRGLRRGRPHRVPPRPLPGPRARSPQTATDDGRPKNFFRVTGRLQINLLDPETGFFYAGTYLGTKKILSIGARSTSTTPQHDATSTSRGDVFVDLPLGPAACSPRRSTSRTGTAARPFRRRYAEGDGDHGRGRLPDRRRRPEPDRPRRAPVRQRRTNNDDAYSAAASRSGPTDTTRTSRPSTRTARRRPQRAAATRSTCSGSCTSSRALRG